MNDAIETLLGKITTGMTADEALKITQAILNLANADARRKGD